MRVCVCVSANNIGVEGTKALGPYLAKLNNMTTLKLLCAWWRWCFGVHRPWLFVGTVVRMMVTWFCVCVCVLSDNYVGEEGAKALGPHLAKLDNLTALYLSSAWWRWCLGVHRTWLFVVRVICIVVLCVRV